MIFFAEKYVALLVVSSFVYWLLVKPPYRTKFLILISIVPLACIQFEFTLFFVFLVLLVFQGSKRIGKKSGSGPLLQYIMILAIILLTFKYAGTMFAALFSHENYFSRSYLVPLGISYLSFKLISFVIDAFRGAIKNPKLEDLYAYILFLPIFSAGPIERFQNFIKFRKAEFDLSFYLDGVGRIVLGYFKKTVIVNYFLYYIVFKFLKPQIVADGISLDISALVIVCFLCCAFLYAYVDISAYADIAIGFGRLFGYTICENMRLPIIQPNLSEFWNRWHMSLSFWCRDYVYFPVLIKYRRTYLALYCSFLIMGLWHSVSLNWIAWGLWHATGLTVYSQWNNFRSKNEWLQKLLPANSKIVYAAGMIMTFLFVAMGYSFTMMDSVRDGFKLILAIFM